MSNSTLYDLKHGKVGGLNIRDPCDSTLINFGMQALQQYRTEKDTFGDLQVPADRYWGAQTQRYDWLTTHYSFISISATIAYQVSTKF